MKIKKFIIASFWLMFGLSVLFFGLMAYKGSIYVNPDKLPNAKIGHYYNEGIVIYATHPIKSIGPMNEPNIATSFGDNGLIVSYNRNNYDNTIWIKGIPEHKGTYNIKVQTGFSAGGGLFLDKTFELVVE